MLLRKKFIFLTIITLIAFGSGASCGGDKNTLPPEQKGKTEQEEMNLTMWGVFDDSSMIQPLIDRYEKIFPNVNITYSKKDFSDYESLMVDAIASGEGPDMLMIHNDWLPKHKSKLSAMSDDIFTIEEYSDYFIDCVYQDFVSSNQAYAIPLYTDNLALIYNEDIFDDNQLFVKPSTWEDIIQYSKILAKTVPGNPNKIDRGGIALGTANNITRSSDILLSIMMQTGTPIISGDKRSFNFNQFRKNDDGTPYYPGTSALEFYTGFSNPSKDVFSWDEEMENSITAFANGRVSMMLGYSYFLPIIRQINPNIKIETTGMPQIKGSKEYITLANYWAWSVNRNSKNKEAAWGFLRFASENFNPSNRPPARKDARSAIAEYKVFSDQAPFARTVYKGDNEEFDKIFNEMIESVSVFSQSPQITIDSAARKANEMLERYY